MKLATFVGMAVFAACLGAQTQTTQSETRTTTTTSGQTVNLEGTLVDQGCYTTQTHEKSTNSDGASTTTTETNKVTSDCPATASTTNFGLITPDGRFVRFDDASNARVVDMMRSNQEWASDISAHRPVKVRVVALPNGNVMVIKEIK